MTYVKTMIVIAALTLLAAFTVSAQTYTLVKIKKPVNTIETRWPQVSIRETLEYLVDRDDLDPVIPADRDAYERDDQHRPGKSHPTF